MYERTNEQTNERNRTKRHKDAKPNLRGGEISHSLKSELARAHDFNDVESRPGYVVAQHLPDKFIDISVSHNINLNV